MANLPAMRKNLTCLTYGLVARSVRSNKRQSTRLRPALAAGHRQRGHMRPAQGAPCVQREVGALVHGPGDVFWGVIRRERGGSRLS